MVQNPWGQLQVVSLVRYRQIVLENHLKRWMDDLFTSHPKTASG